MRILIIANPLAAIRKNKKAVLDDITNRVIRADGSVDITYSMRPGMGRHYATRAPLEGYDAVLVAGGDGTVNDVASGLINRNIPLGIIPVGTGNGLARSLGISFDPARIVDSLLKKKTMTIDTGKIANHYFLATAGIGFDAYIARDFNANRGEGDSISKYVMYAIKNYFLKSSERVTLIADGTEMNRKIFALTICNVSQYGGGAVIAPQASPTDGNLIAVVIPKFNLLKAPFVARKLFNGSIQDVRGIEYIPFKTLKIKRPKTDIVQYDGETFSCNNNINVTAMPSSLNIIVP